MTIGEVKLKRMSVTDLNPADYNPRMMTDKARQGLSNSIDTFGLVQPIIWNKRTGNVVGGHQRLYDIVNKGAEETDVVVVDLPMIQEKALNISLNNTSIAGGYTEGVKELLDEIDDELKNDLLLNEIELDLGESEGLPEEKYAKKIQAPTYEAGDKKPAVASLYDETKKDELLTSIEKANISEADKEFLRAATNRHIVFNYQSIADYYAHSPKEVQELMEKSALVIIDFNSAIENGYVQLSEEIKSRYMEDYDV